MTPVARKSLLTVHVLVSVAWIGAVAAFLAMNIVALTSEDAVLYRAMDVTGLYVIVPASVLSVLSGIVQGLATQWGLLRYRWVATKLLIGVVSTILLLLHQFSVVAEAAHRAEHGLAIGGLGVQLVVDAALAIAALVFATTLSTFKPWGEMKTPPRKLLMIVVGVVIVIIVVKHVAGGGMHH